jgi:hypothetical protein
VVKFGEITDVQYGGQAGKFEGLRLFWLSAATSDVSTAALVDFTANSAFLRLLWAILRGRLCCGRGVSSNRIKKIAQPQHSELQLTRHRPNLLAPMKERVRETTGNQTFDRKRNN